MANFLGNIGAALQGQQNFQNQLQQQKYDQLRLQAEQLQVQQAQQAAQQAQAQQANQGIVSQNVLDILAGAAPAAIPAPPAAQNPTNAPQAPAPGQASVPMVQPNAQYGQKPIPGGPQGIAQPPQGPQQGASTPPQGVPQVPPYKTVNASPAPQAAPQGIPPPPAQGGIPMPNSMTIQDAAKLIKDRGIKDPVVALQVLDRLTPYLNTEAKQEASMLKMQLDQKNKESALQEKYIALQTASEDKRFSIQERTQYQQMALQALNAWRTATLGIQQQNANTRAEAVKQKVAAGNSLTKDDTDFMADQYWAGDKSVLTGLARTPQALAAVRSAITQKGKELGKSGADLAQATAEFKGLEAGEQALGRRTAQVAVAANEAKTFAQNALAASNKVNRTNFPDFNKILLAGEQKTGDPDVVAFGSYNNSLINAYARAVNPNGSPTNSDKDHARDILSTNYSKGQYKAAVDVILKEIDAAKAAPQAAKKELKDLANSGNAEPAPIPAGWSITVK